MRHLITYRNLTIANRLLPAIAYNDFSGLEDDDIDQLNSFLTDLESEIATFCEELSPDKYFYDIVFDMTELQALCSPATVLVTTFGGSAPYANLYEYTSFTD